MGDEEVEYMQEFYRWRLRTLQSTDELVEAVVKRVEDLGISDNTYIIYSSDNGYHIGQHRLGPGKASPYEEDVNIPLMVRGPGVAKGRTITNIPTTHTDWAPTILKLAGIDEDYNFDGTPIPLTDDISPTKHEHVSLEFWGDIHFDGKYHAHHPNNTYKALRVIGSDGGYNLFYSVWCTHEHELYDMTTDKAQMKNLMGSGDKTLKIGGKEYKVSQLQPRLDALVQVLRKCSGKTCIQPWEKIHHDGKVNSLVDALGPQFDHFYEKQQVPMKYEECTMGYFPAKEGPDPIAFGGEKIDTRDFNNWDQHEESWEDWT